jgi:uncharacterized repeat protein (TIGR04076 family)
MTQQSEGPWDLSLEVIDILGEPGCGWNYPIGFKTRWDGRHFPKGMCPFAWNAFSPLIWALRYAASNRSFGKVSEDEMTLVCPDPRHQIVWRVRQIGDGAAARQPDALAAGPVWKLGIEVDGLPKGPGCERGYQVGDSWDYDGDIPEGFCPLAWNALSLWVWPLRYGGSPRAMAWQGDSVMYNCPNFENPVVFHVYRTEMSDRMRGGA